MFSFRPNMENPDHREAWRILKGIPEGQKNLFLVRAILREHDTISPGDDPENCPGRIGGLQRGRKTSVQIRPAGDSGRGRGSAGAGIGFYFYAAG